MNSATKLVIKIVCLCAIFLPYKLVFMAGKETSFLQDFLVAGVGYLIGHGVIALISRGSSEE